MRQSHGILKLENESQVQGVVERDLRHSTGNVRIQTIDFFRILVTRVHTFTKKAEHTHSDRDGFWLY